MESVEQLRQRIAKLEAENRRLRAGVFQPSNVRTVLVPETLRALFDVAQTTVFQYFQDLTVDPARGIIEIGGQRYVLIRASSLSIEFLDAILNLYADRGDKEARAIGKSLLFDISHCLGISDARNFHERMGLTDPIAKLSAGPVHFAYCGWALVDIKPESNPVPNEDYYLIYDHPYSFEAASWVQAGRQADSPHCIMNAGYSSGWCEESFGIELTAVEISCRAKGDESCTFVMAPPARIAARVRQFFGTTHEDVEVSDLYIPSYFDRKHAEEALREKAAELEQAYQQLAEAHLQLKETQAKHIQATRLASIGELAAGVAHELNSPLCVAHGYANLLCEQLTSLPAQQSVGSRNLLKRVSKIRTATERCMMIVNDLLAFSRQSRGTMGQVRIAEVVDRTLDLIARQIREAAIAIERHIPADLTVWGNADQLQQVLTNIVLNAVQAIGHQGMIAITARPTEDGMLSLEIQDDGPGIPPDHRDQIFDPFFTTKPMGQGTGLGLSIVYGLVRNHGGQILVDSPPDGGTTFVVKLPVQEFSG